MRFLVVDDEPEIVMLVRANVRAWGHECLSATTTADAYDIVRAQRPDVLLLDIAMPVEDGTALLRRLRDEDIAPAHVVFVSALPPDQVKQLADELGVPYLTKPFTAPELRDAVNQLHSEEAR